MVNWIKVSGVSGAIAAVAAVLALFPQFQNASSVSDTVAVSDTAGRPKQVASTPSTSPPTTGRCADPNGHVTACGNADAGVVVNVASCTTDAALAALGINASRQLDVTAASVADLCVVAPGNRAKDEGATSADVLRLAGGESVPHLTLCYASANGPEVLCSQPHLHEYVGPWMPYDGISDTKTLCDATARKYTGRTFDAPNEPLQLGLLRGDDNGKPYYRCAISTYTPRTGSVWKIGSKQ